MILARVTSQPGNCLHGYVCDQGMWHEGRGVTPALVWFCLVVEVCGRSEGSLEGHIPTSSVSSGQMRSLALPRLKVSGRVILEEGCGRCYRGNDKEQVKGSWGRGLLAGTPEASVAGME